MSPKIKIPGIAYKEMTGAAHPIHGVATSIAGFIGAAKNGPVHKPVRILSFMEFERHFGGLMEEAELGYAIRQYFLNGGVEAWVVRIARKAKRAAIQKALSTLGKVDLFNF